MAKKKKGLAKAAGKTGEKAKTSGAALAATAVELLKRVASDAADHAKAAGAVAATAKPMGPQVAAAATAALPNKAVVFTCSNADCVVGLTAGAINIVFIGTGGATMPVGTFPLFWRVQGIGAFTVTAQGATLSSPISSVAPDAGIRTLTVTP